MAVNRCDGESVVFSVIGALGLGGLTYLALQKLAPLESLRPDQLTLVKWGGTGVAVIVGASVPQALCNPCASSVCSESARDVDMETVYLTNVDMPINCNPLRSGATCSTAVVLLEDGLTYDETQLRAFYAHQAEQRKEGKQMVTPSGFSVPTFSFYASKLGRGEQPQQKFNDPVFCPQTGLTYERVQIEQEAQRAFLANEGKFKGEFESVTLVPNCQASGTRPKAVVERKVMMRGAVGARMDAEIRGLIVSNASVERINARREALGLQVNDESVVDLSYLDLSGLELSNWNFHGNHKGIDFSNTTFSNCRWIATGGDPHSRGRTYNERTGSAVTMTFCTWTGANFSNCFFIVVPGGDYSRCTVDSCTVKYVYVDKYADGYVRQVREERASARNWLTASLGQATGIGNMRFS